LQIKNTLSGVNYLLGAELGVCTLRKQQQFVVFSKQTGVPQHDLGIPCAKKDTRNWVDFFGAELGIRTPGYC